MRNGLLFIALPIMIWAVDASANAAYRGAYAVGPAAPRASPTPMARAAGQPPMRYSVVVSPPKAVYTPYPDPRLRDCYRAPSHDAADLCAQWRMAMAAERLVDQAERSMLWFILTAVLGAVSLIALLVTLFQSTRAIAETRRANRIAIRTNVRAIRDSAQNATDMARALDLAQETALYSRDQVESIRAAERAFLYVEPGEPHLAEWLDGRAAIAWPFRLFNAGRTPASVQRLVAGLYVPETDEAVEVLRQAPVTRDSLERLPVPEFVPAVQFTQSILVAGDRGGLHTVQAGHPLLDHREGTLHHRLARLVNEKAGVLWLRVQVFYLNAWGASHMTTSTFSVEPVLVDNVVRWVPFEGGGRDFNKRS